ncbi:hypothetical protein HRQ91_03510 [Treponema parvum]|uniref:Carbohydrate kinase PfkB domain-containing protein n=1 Tax=Treponema parvum TaxID=138851 RepID=A0A975F3F6_9SPIR|nr:PfkB family carbohydrate kinase [Treponema parvum]QTQ13596.1 hypothetical protein HRQ91_03510 [Treponema parvum]
MKVTAVCLSSTIQKTITFENLKLKKVNRSQRYVVHASGKAVNSARVLDQLESGFCEAICPVGKENAQRFLALAAREIFPIKSVFVPGFTRECWTLLNKKNSSVTELVVSEPPLFTDMSNSIKELTAMIDKSLEKTEALLIAGSRPAIWPENLNAEICKLAADKGRLVMADFWGKDLEKTLEVCTPHIIKINEDEFYGTFKLPPAGKDESELARAVCGESKRLKNIIVVTRGTKSTVAGENGNLYMQKTIKTKAVNTIGCGDAFSAGFLYTYIKTKDIKKSLETGAECGAKNAALEMPGSIK